MPPTGTLLSPKGIPMTDQTAEFRHPSPFPIPHGSFEWHPTEQVDMAEIERLEVRLLNETRMITTHVGGRGDVAAELQIVGRVGEWEITRHDYHGAIEFHCNCPRFEAGRGCSHMAAFQLANAE